ncbi:MAG: AhpC/TSA family protein [Muribaculaceae bacterium]|nr:AhpC/TSA family protein [Muribaculaceae bacterium]
MKSRFLTIGAAAILAACSGANAAQGGDGYRVSVQLPEEDDEMMAFLVNYDTNAKIDSAMVEESKAVFTGRVDEPVAARVIVDGQRRGQFILENAEIEFGGDKSASSPLNDVLTDLYRRGRAIIEEARALPEDSSSVAKAQALEARYDALSDSVMRANIDNPVGYVLFCNDAWSLSLAELKAELDKAPSLKKYQRVQKLLASAEAKERTTPGHKFVDFTVTNDSVAQSLSDYVGKGKYVLVDFWASWCGPCIRETKVIKEILNELGPKGLEVLGVAVWDEPQNTLRAIQQHKLPWPQILNTQSVATDLYGIPAIPCIILFGPDGTIISRDKQGDELKEAVRQALSGEAPKE